jgi:hypothetical protein
MLYSSTIWKQPYMALRENGRFINNINISGFCWIPAAVVHIHCTSTLWKVLQWKGMTILQFKMAVVHIYLYCEKTWNEKEWQFYMLKWHSYKCDILMKLFRYKYKVFTNQQGFYEEYDE